MKTDAELLAAAHDLCRRLGGIGSADARLVRGLWERWQAAMEAAKAAQALLDSASADCTDGGRNNWCLLPADELRATRRRLAAAIDPRDITEGTSG